MKSADTFVATGWFWRAWPDFAEQDDFKLKSEARAYCARNGGGAMRKIRYLGDGPSTEGRSNTIYVADGRKRP